MLSTRAKRVNPANDIVENKTSPGRCYEVTKRAMDISLSALALVVLFPLMLGLSFLIKVTSPGPALFRQRRVGRSGKEFTCFKFRTMRNGASPELHQRYFSAYVRGEPASSEGKGGQEIYKVVDDPRVTRVGGRLRATCLDELPQFVNVFRGEMSLVGPRPAIPYELEMYSPHHFQRLAVKPGITGLWQVKGHHLAPFEQMVEMDLDYIRRRSLGMDMKLILLTVPRLLGIKGRGRHG